VGGIAAAIIALAIAGGVVAYSVLSGGGAQPEDVVPGTALAFAKVDLDPAAGQKVALARLLLRLDPASEAASADADDPRAAFGDTIDNLVGIPVDYDNDVAPWLGVRAGFAALPGAESAADPEPLIVLASTDDDAAREALARVFPPGGEYTAEVRDGYALIGSPAAIAAAQGPSLAETEAFTASEDAVGDSLALGFVNVDAVLAEAERPGGAPVTGFEGLTNIVAEVPSPIGARTVVAGVSAEPDAVRLDVRAFGVTKGAPVSGAPLTLDSATVALVALRGGVGTLLEDIGPALTDITGGLVGGDDLAGALGEAITVEAAVGTAPDGSVEPVVQATISGDDVGAIAGFWNGLGPFLGLDVAAGSDSVVLSQPDADEVFGQPGDLTRITSLLPDAQQAAFLVFVDVDAIEAAPAGADLDQQARQISAAGASFSLPRDGEAAGTIVVRFG
jgi:hypothetical protein